MSDLDKLVADFETRLNKHIGALETYNKDKAKLQQEIDTLEAFIQQPKDILDIVAKAVSKFREEYTREYSLEVSNGLSYVMEGTTQSATCLMDFSKDGKQLSIEIEIKFHNGKSIQGAPRDIEGGGSRDVMAVVFTMGYINQKPAIRGPVWMDEPTKQLSAEYSEPFYKYIGRVKDTIQNQIILITHDKNIIKNAKFAHHAIEIGLAQDGSSQVLTAQTS